MERYFGTGFKLCWSHVLVAALLLCSVPAAQAQSGFLNIDCGATAEYVDSVTGLTWVPDAPYIPTGKIQSAALPTSLDSFTEMKTLRYFDDSRSKNCYKLPVTAGGTYLLRATFFYGDYDNANQPPSFQLAIDATILDNVTATPSGASYAEYHYMSQGNVTYLCLIRTSAVATPFISGISLKEASALTTGYADQYGLYLQQGVIMKSRGRVNFGGTTMIRAPDDYYDRFWFPESSTFLYYLTPTLSPHEFLSTTSPIKDLVNSSSGPPSAVMQTAVTSSGIIESYLLPQDWPTVETSVYLSFYYAELNNTASPPLRNFTIEVPELTVYTADVDMSGYAFLDYGGWDFWLDSVKMLNTTTVVLTPLNTSVAGPIFNCMEIFAKSDPRVPKTVDRDAMAIEDIKKSLNLTEWTGDPCLPTPHSWITCTNTDSTTSVQPVITAVNLSGYQLEGSIPGSFDNLWDLSSLDLSNNSLSGPLPDWLTTMTALRVLAVQNNNLSGAIPSGLLSANSQIRFTYFGNPYLTGGVAPSPAPAPALAPACGNCGKSNIAVIAGASAGGAVGVIIVIALAIFVCCRCQRKRKHSEELRASKRMGTPGGAKAYTYAEVSAATSQFKRELGRGGFGPVYYGTFPDRQEVAVKVADGSSKQGEREFFNEVDVLSRVHHKNLVALVGYCQEQKQILIYEYMQNGSLSDHLHGNSVTDGVLNWRMRLHIALNAAQGLEYLHTACRPSFVHRDVKSRNILLTPTYEAKVADFGLTRLLGEAEGTLVMTDVMGTAGYLDPEYYTSHYITPKSDVYSFGVVLLELLTGTLPIDEAAPKDRNPNLVCWARERLQLGDIDSILDSVVKASNPNMEAVWKVAEIAMRSVEPKSKHRPTMTDVIQELQGALAIEATRMPRAPASTRGPAGAPAPHSWPSSGFSESYSSGLYGPTSHPAPR